MLLDSEHKILRMNETMANRLGLKPSEVIGKKCYELVHATDKPLDNCPHKQLLDDGHEHTEEVYEERLSSYYLVTTTPLLNADGVTFGSVHVMRDITKLKDTENSLRAKTSALDLLNKNLEDTIKNKVEEIRQNEILLIQQAKMAAMGEMIGVITHQWKQPLNIIVILIQDIKDAWYCKELDEVYINKTVGEGMKQIDFMSKTITDFRNFFKPSKEKETFDLIRIAEDVFSLYSHQLKINSINYKITCHVHSKSFSHFSQVIPCGATTITTYRSYLLHAVLNIIINSNDAIIERRQKGEMDNEGMIGIDIYRDNCIMRMEISDNGGGIHQGVIERIFDPYFTTKEGEKGTGIGLHMSKIIVENVLGGKIHARNIKSGAVITIELKDAMED